MASYDRCQGGGLASSEFHHGFGNEKSYLCVVVDLMLACFGLAGFLSDFEFPVWRIARDKISQDQKKQLEPVGFFFLSLFMKKTCLVF